MNVCGCVFMFILISFQLRRIILCSSFFSFLFTVLFFSFLFSSSSFFSLSFFELIQKRGGKKVRLKKFFTIFSLLYGLFFHFFIFLVKYFLIWIISIGKKKFFSGLFKALKKRVSIFFMSLF